MIKVESVADFCVRAALGQSSHTCCSAKEIFIQVVFKKKFLQNIHLFKIFLVKLLVLSQEDIFEAVSGCLKKLVENIRVGDPFATKVPPTV